MAFGMKRMSSYNTESGARAICEEEYEPAGVAKEPKGGFLLRYLTSTTMPPPSFDGIDIVEAPPRRTRYVWRKAGLGPPIEEMLMSLVRINGSPYPLGLYAPYCPGAPGAPAAPGAPGAP